MNPGHGDMRIPVIAPGTVEECFLAGAQGLNWAERYQGPVIVLTEMQLAERAQDIERPDVSKLPVENRAVSDGSVGNHRYAGDSVSPFPVPGGPGAYVANASEHDEQGDTTHQSDVHIGMTHRRFAKLRLLEDEAYEAEGTDASIAVMPWGTSKGPTRDAWQQLREAGVDLGWYYTMYLSPLSPKLLDELLQKELVIVPELNYMGQFSMILRQYGVKAVSVTQYTGLPFKVSNLVQRIREEVGATSERLARV